MSFEDDFPSLKNKEIDIDKQFINAGDNAYFWDVIASNCLDKQKVKEAINKCLMDLVNDYPEEYDVTILYCTNLKNKLGLGEKE